MKTTLKSIYINDKKADGTPYKDKNGNPFKMAVIETTDGVKASMYLHHKFGEKDLKTISEWKEGDEVNIIIEKAGDFTNFKIPTKTDLLEERVLVLEDKLEKLGTFVKQHFSK